ncbi:MAG: hypothetical protein ACKO69_02320, partial [Limnohabitans sp.]
HCERNVFDKSFGILFSCKKYKLQKQKNFSEKHQRILRNRLTQNQLVIHQNVTERPYVIAFD